ncbi:unnamed protein product [Triticum turgidum subsp. durum]|uniref:tRNA/rRNA methyltransferase SpoU type domain-containing protein n=1 Tax=Triticum turgidum subsp. durum TaxID=4567 RepID=A0A9R0QQI9_TRITD|nr:unnamed protein product [Triticum turgidum subsp. durum]
MAAAAAASGATAAVESVAVVHNVAKRHNVGTLARSATAFGDERGCDICGVEITDDALPVTAHPFRRSTAFLFGNERGTRMGITQLHIVDICNHKCVIAVHSITLYFPYCAGTMSVSADCVIVGTGLSQKECEVCDFFVYIPQYGGGTASLNVTVAASIVLHHFGVWAGFPERGREGNKFVVAEKPRGQSRGLYCSDSIEDLIEERKARRENACDIFEENGSNHPQESNGLGMMFTD